MKAMRFVSCVMVIGLALTGCGGTQVPEVDPAEAAGGDAELEELIEQAQEEGELVWYSARSESIASAVNEAFTEKYGVEARYIRLSSSDIAQRFSSEANAGAVAADVLLTSDDEFVATTASEGDIISLAEAGIPGYPGILPEESLKYDQRAATVQIAPWSFAYNTNLVSPGDAPSSWEGLLDPRWRGQILMPDPGASAAYIMFWAAIRERYGDEFLRQFAAQQPMIMASSAPALESLAAGEGMIAAPGLADSLATLKSSGAPVEAVQPEFTTGTEIVVAIAAGAPHPAAARLFAHYVMSEEGNEVLNDFEGIASPADAEELPDEYTPADFEAVAQREEIVELLGL